MSKTSPTSGNGQETFALPPLDTLAGETFDVVICGGGLAGLTLARQLALSMPERRLLVVDRVARPIGDATHKVGESSVELGSHYFERLGLRDYLLERHLIKFGLRFFPGGGQLPLEARTEIGPGIEPIVPSYQLDRGRFEHDLRGMIEADGVTLAEGVKVTKIDLFGVPDDHAGDVDPDALHAVELGRDGERVQVKGRWVVDASGRASLMRKRLKLTRGTKHPANAAWFRLDGKLDPADLVPASATEWHGHEWAEHRWRSTNHLMGPGYWAWIIPLGSGKTSIGLVVHDTHHDFDRLRSLDRVLEGLREHEPILAAGIDKHEILDFGCLKNYSHNAARCFSRDRWALVGEAGAFADPFYSPGSDFIAFGNAFTEEMIRADLEEGASLDVLTDRARELSAVYRSLVEGCIDVYRPVAEVYGHADAMLAKIYWDNFVYWSYTCQIYFQRLYELRGEALNALTPLGQRFAGLTKRIQYLFDAWARHAPAEPEARTHLIAEFPSVVIQAHLDLQKEMSHAEALELMTSRMVEAEEIMGEMILRAIDEVGEEHAEALVDEAKVLEWAPPIRSERVAAIGTIGLARRKALRPLAKDVERSLGRAPNKVSEDTVRRLLAPLITDAPAESVA